MTSGRIRSRCVRASTGGFALIVVLLVVALLEVLVADLAAYSWLSMRQSHNFAREAQNMVAVDGVVRLARATLFQPDLTPGRRAEILQQGLRNVRLGEATIDVTIQDETGKWNLNRLLDADQETAETAHKEFIALCSALGKDEALAERIVNFMTGAPATPDGEPGIERHLILLEELREVPGVTDAFLFGSAGSKPLSDYVTPWGDGRLNVNTASKEVLQAVLAESAPDLPDRILQGREVHPFESLEEVLKSASDPLPESAQLPSRLTIEPESYQLIVTCRSGDGVQVQRAILEKDGNGGAIVRICRKER